jgi:protease YdgD
MHGLAALALALAVVGGAAPAQDAPARRLLTADEAVPFRGVGRVNVAGTRFCTGTLVAPDEVLTAAHCLFHPQTRAMVPPEELRFVAGLNVGTRAAVRKVVRAVPHPRFVFEGAADPAGVQADLALLVLAAPVGPRAAAPLGVAALGPGPVAIVSYARDRSQAPSIEAPCGVISRFGDAAALACAVTYGVSGAPVLQGTGPGMRVVAVVSAMGRTSEGRDVALSALVAPSLALLREQARIP